MTEQSHVAIFVALFFIFMGVSVFFGGFLTNINMPQEFRYMGNNYMIVGGILALVGFVILVAGKGSETSGKPQVQRAFQGKICGNCHFFGKEQCPKKEKLFNTMPCEDFTP